MTKDKTSTNLKPNFTQIPNIIIDFMMNELSGADFKVLIYISRRTYGFQKEWDKIATSQIMNGIKKDDEDKILEKGTGLSNKQVINSIKNLVDLGIIISETGANYQTKKYKINTDWTYEESSHVKKVHSTYEESSQVPMKKVHKQKKEKERKKESISKENNFDFLFEDWYKKYPLHKSKSIAQKKFIKLLQDTDDSESLLKDIHKGLDNYIAEIKLKGTEQRYIAHPSTWLNQERWKDDYITENKNDKYFERFEKYYKAYTSYILKGVGIDVEAPRDSWNKVNGYIEFSDELFDDIKKAMKNYKTYLLDKYGVTKTSKAYTEDGLTKIKTIESIGVYEDELNYIITPANFITSHYKKYLK